jgi:hypothetical protein
MGLSACFLYIHPDIIISHVLKIVLNYIYCPVGMNAFNAKEIKKPDLAVPTSSHAKSVIALANKKPQQVAPQAIKSESAVMPVIIGCKNQPARQVHECPVAVYCQSSR